MKEKELERILKALANKRRLAILRYLKKEKKASVGDIASEIRLSFTATSKHLHILAAVDIIEQEQRSLQVFYSISKKQLSVVRSVLTLFSNSRE